MVNDPFYLIGRRAGVKPVANDLSVTSLRAEDSRGNKALRTWGWSAATFGAGAILGWMAGAKKGEVVMTSIHAIRQIQYFVILGIAIALPVTQLGLIFSGHMPWALLLMPAWIPLWLWIYRFRFANKGCSVQSQGSRNDQ